MASTFFGVNAGTVPPGSPVEVGVFVDTEGQTVNAVAGDVIVPKDTEVRISNGDSLISLWVVQPTLTNDRIHFEGVIPGGITSSQLPLFSVVLTPATPGDLFVSTEGVKVYKHDGLGTLLPVKDGMLKLMVAEGAAPVPTRGNDVTPPEAFTPVIAHDPNIANGKTAIIFATTDTASGIDHYEVRELNGPGIFHRVWDPSAESPYVLRSTLWPFGKVEVMAVDRAGNIRIESVARPFSTQSALLLGGCILALVIVALLFATAYRRRIWRKQNRSRSR